MISVVIPTYNSKSDLENCLKSIFRQTVPRDQYEVIVVDDGSSDGTGELAQKYPIKYYYQENQGPASARNFGVAKSQGEIVLFMDADCEPIANLIEVIAESFQDPKIAGLKGFYRSDQSETAAKFAQLEYEYKYRKIIKKQYIDFVDTYTAAYRKEILVKEGGFDTHYKIASGEDIDLSYRLAEKGYRLIINNKAIVYHQHPGSLKDYLGRKYKVGFWRSLLYKKHTQKIFADSHTPISMKLQVVIIYLLFLVSALLVIDLNYYWWLMVLSIVFLIVSLPFVIFCGRRNLKVGIVSLPIIFLRTAVLSWGLIVGYYNLILKQLIFGKQEITK